MKWNIREEITSVTYVALVGLHVVVVINMVCLSTFLRPKFQGFHSVYLTV